MLDSARPRCRHQRFPSRHSQLRLSRKRIQKQPFYRRVRTAAAKILRQQQSRPDTDDLTGSAIIRRNVALQKGFAFKTAAFVGGRVKIEVWDAISVQSDGTALPINVASIDLKALKRLETKPGFGQHGSIAVVGNATAAVTGAAHELNAIVGIAYISPALVLVHFQ